MTLKGVIKQSNVEVSNSAVYASLLRIYGERKELYEGKRLHSHMASIGCASDAYLGNFLVQMYGNCGSSHDARAAFDQIQNPTSYSWNIMIKAYAQNGHVHKARSVFDSMPEPNIVSWTSMVAAYAQKGYLEEARCMFDEMPQRNVVSWNAMISGYAQNGYSRQALQLYSLMDMHGVPANRVTFISVLYACADLASFQEGKIIHVTIINCNLCTEDGIGAGIVNMYGKCGAFEEAKQVFMEAPSRNILTWNAMIGACVQNENLVKARQLFSRMPRTDVVTWNSLLTGYAQQGQLADAEILLKNMPQPDIASWNALIAAYAQHGIYSHAFRWFQAIDVEGVLPDRITFCSICGTSQEPRIIQDYVVECGFQSDLMIANALINMYGKYGEVFVAKRMFDAMPVRDAVSWTAMIAAYTHNSQYANAFELFQLMDLEGLPAHRSTFVVALTSCAGLASASKGKLVHAEIMSAAEYDSEAQIGSVLVHMYAKCGNLMEAKCIHDNLQNKTLFASTSILAAYTSIGDMQAALDIFHWVMLEDLQPDEFVFTSILHGCSHEGKLDDGIRHFTSMQADYNMNPTVEHYLQIIDLLGRASRITEAEDLMQNMPYEPTEVAWTILLGAYKVHGKLQKATLAAQRVFVLYPKTSAPYALLAATSY